MEQNKNHIEYPLKKLLLLKKREISRSEKINETQTTPKQKPEYLSIVTFNLLFYNLKNKIILLLMT